jgi:hypothetical protein
MATLRQITIEYQHTSGLYNYSSVRSGVSFTVDVAEGENVEVLIKCLQEQARAVVHEEIDRSLVEDGRKPKFKRVELDEVPF